MAEKHHASSPQFPGIASAHVSNQRYEENVAKNCSMLPRIRRYGTVHYMQKTSLSLSTRFMQIYKQSSRSVNYLSQAVNSHRFNQSDIDTMIWYHGTAASNECLQAPLCTPSSPDRSRLIPLALDYTRLTRPKPKREPVRRLCKVNFRHLPVDVDEPGKEGLTLTGESSKRHLSELPPSENSELACRLCKFISVDPVF